MKKLALTIAVLLSINISNIWAEQNATTASSVRYVKAPHFARPLIEKWITEYAKTQPGVEFQIAKGNQKQANIDLNVATIKIQNHKTLAIPLFISESSPCCLSQPVAVKLRKCCRAST